MAGNKKLRQTAFSDVCGTMDELKRLIDEGKKESVYKKNSLAGSLAADAEFMLKKMDSRLKEYREFSIRIIKSAESLNSVGPAGIEEGLSGLQKLFGIISSKKPRDAGLRIEIFGLAEAVREAATLQEHKMREYKDLALKVNELFTSVRGTRPWLLADEDDGSYRQNLVKKYQAWLPPEPHQTRLLDRICKSKNVTIEPAEAGEEPSVNFEDGGAIKMSRVRYDEDIQNFHPAGFKPGKSARSYRRKDPGAMPG